MTRRDYVKIAAVLKEGKASTEMVRGFVVMLKEDNERFDVTRFLVACDAPIFIAN